MRVTHSNSGTIVALVIVAVAAVAVTVWLAPGLSPSRSGRDVATVVRAPLSGRSMPDAPVPDADGGEADLTAPPGSVESVPVARDEPFRMAAGELLGIPRVFRGRVVDEDGHPLPGATVRWLADSQTRALIGSSGIPGPDIDMMPVASTDSLGRFVLSVRSASSVGVPSWPPGLVSLSEIIAMAPDHAPAVVQESDVSARESDIGDIHLGPARTIVGRAVGEDGRPIADVQVVFSVEAGGWTGGLTPRWADDALAVWRDRTGRDGRFRIDDVRLGAGTLTLSGHLCSKAELPIEADGGDPKRLDLGDLWLERKQVLRGRVVSPDGRGIAGAMVAPYDESLGLGLWFLDLPESDPCALSIFITDYEQTPWTVPHTQPDGTFVLGRPDHFEEQPWSVLVGAPGHTMGLERMPEIGDPGLTIVLHRIPPLAIRIVHAASGDPVEDPSVHAYRGCDVPDLEFHVFERALAARTSAGPSSPTTHVVEHPTAPGTWLVVTAMGLEARSVWIATDAPDGAPVEIELETEGRIEGRVYDEMNRPVSGAIVCGYADGAPSSFPRRLDTGLRLSVTDETGRYVLEHLSAGVWAVKCRGPASVEVASAIGLVVRPGETLDGVDLAVEAAWMYYPSDG